MEAVSPSNFRLHFFEIFPEMVPSATRHLYQRDILGPDRAIRKWSTCSFKYAAKHPRSHRRRLVGEEAPPPAAMLFEKLGAIAARDEQLAACAGYAHFDVACALRLGQLGQRAAQLLDHLSSTTSGSRSGSGK